MKRILPEMPDGGWYRVFIWTALTTIGVVLCVLIGTDLINRASGKPTTEVDIYSGIILSVFMTVPILGFLTLKIQQLRLANQKLHNYAITDSLTGWLNRAAFTDRVERAMGEASASSTPEVGAVLVIDIDHFKSVNDTLGHQAGDAALRTITQVLRRQLRDNDIFGRLGGEEFGVYLTGADQKTAIAVAERCRTAVEALRFESDGEIRPLSVSIGVSIIRGLTSFAATYRDADRKLYYAKETGRNRVVAAMPNDRSAAPGRLHASSGRAA